MRTYQRLMFVRSLLFPLFIFSSLTLLAAPPEGKDWVPFPQMSDEFDDDGLDSNKWWPENKTWKGRRPVMFHPDCVTVKDGTLKLSAMTSEESKKRNLRNGYTHISGYVRSKVPIRFGYFEMRAKLMDSSLVSCFWLYNHARREWSELDIVEIAAGVSPFDKRITPNVHYFYGPHYRGTLDDHITDQSSHDLKFRPADDFHVYGLEWTPTHIRWFVDGELIRESENKLFFQPLYLNMNVESNKYFKALPDDARLPGVYEIDYVRVWRDKEFVDAEKK